MITFASVSGGKDSVAMLLMCAERGIHVDEAVTFDTGWEFPETQEAARRAASEAGVPLVVLEPTCPFDRMLSRTQVIKDGGVIQRGLGFARPNARWCTARKTKRIGAYMRSRSGGDYVQLVGIAADEAERARDDARKRYPLVEWGVTEAMALDYCRSRGYRWGGCTTS